MFVHVVQLRTKWKDHERSLVRSGNQQEKIQEMTSVLTKQKADEAVHKEMCVDDLNENALTTEDKDGMKNRTENKIVLLKAKIGGCEQDWVTECSAKGTTGQQHRDITLGYFSSCFFSTSKLDCSLRFKQ